MFSGRKRWYATCRRKEICAAASGEFGVLNARGRQRGKLGFENVFFARTGQLIRGKVRRSYCS